MPTVGNYLDGDYRKYWLGTARSEMPETNLKNIRRDFSDLMHRQLDEVTRPRMKKWIEKHFAAGCRPTGINRVLGSIGIRLQGQPHDAALHEGARGKAGVSGRAARHSPYAGDSRRQRAGRIKIYCANSRAAGRRTFSQISLLWQVSGMQRKSTRKPESLTICTCPMSPCPKSRTNPTP